ncbi:hypothetical protein QBC33DRAFT_174687 [Phialemonium atrogriseum]|uniref:Uncharacterized protein n=1 Tax=Phialemonium atrogriseum TaxID=1093897 RepID=A0AAJ0FE24_9PEZI|nr:uncharacterized protein QBC33DRAFT_174687 [Phialemonium atrogriseum]KAK1765176.1 hypothetical protein QBC33DRAFT_174687 [Phialemonium atrogriseum]
MAQKLRQLLYPYSIATMIPEYEGDRFYLRAQNFVSKWRKQLIALGVVNTAIFALVLLIYMVEYTKDGSSLDPSSLEFALYKNTFYGPCNQTSESCEIDRPNTLSGSDGDILYWNGNIARESFCPCFSDAKIVPSTPRQSAFGYNGLFIWLTQTITLATGLWTLLTRVMDEEFMAEEEYPPHDAKVSIDTWAFLVFDTVQYIMWWYGFITLARNPAYKAPVALLSWITPWRYLYSLAVPPLASRLPSSAWLWLAAFLATIQWIASAVTASLTKTVGLATVHAEPSFVRYDFAEQFWAASSGTTNCSAGDVAALIGLFTSPGSRAGRYSSANTAYLFSFVANSLGAFIATYFYLRSGGTSLRGFGITLGFLGLMDYITMAISISPDSEAASTVLYHEACNLLHITMSTNKAYMDVSGYSKGWRAVKGWFNV